MQLPYKWFLVFYIDKTCVILRSFFIILSSHKPWESLSFTCVSKCFEVLESLYL
jgi:hypothetical protein